MASLGWNSLPKYVDDDASVGTQILDYWNSSTAYAFFCMAHGGWGSLSDNRTWYRYSTEVTGNWYFVFLDACDTAVTTEWANAFKTIGYSNRGFLGWYDLVYTDASANFDRQFWPQLVSQTHSNNIKDAAIWAAAQVTQYTPIGYSGGRYYNGRAHS